ncbi:MAG: tetratricopeptide repeat protein [Flavobacteriales bacterium]|jgi:tetratricopeptide (TPR) repeat protein|nr:tetratricopeptide repeat protein [Flavobacteriales bacterium]
MSTRIFLPIAFLSLAAAGHAQPAGPARQDSLWGVWTDPARPDTARLPALERFIREGPLRTRPDSALHLVRMLYDTAAHRGLREQMIAAISLEGILMSRTGDHAAAIDLHRKALEMSRAIGDPRSACRALAHIGNSYYQMQEPWEALRYGTEAMELARSLGMRAWESEYLHNMAVANANMGYMDSSRAQTERSLRIAREIGHERGVLSALVMLGDHHRAAGRTARAEDHYQRAADLAARINEPRMRVDAFFGSAEVHADRKEWDRCIGKGHEALALAVGMNDAFLTEQAYWHLAGWNEQAGRYPEALAALKENMRVHDQVRNDANKAALLRQSVRSEYDRKEAVLRAEMAANEAIAAAEMRRGKAVRNGIAGGGLLVLAGLAAWSFTDRKRRKERFQRTTAELQTRVLRSQMNPHFIFNALNSINAYVQRHDAQAASTFLSKFAGVMRGVLENSRHNEVPLDDDITTLRGYMELERRRSEDKFDFTISVDPAIDPEKVMVPPLVAQPFVENAIWHGFKGKVGPGHITIEVRRSGEQLVWSIADDGVGRGRTAAASPKSPGKTALGTAIARDRLALLQQQYGTPAGFRYEDPAQGTHVVVRMPLIAA